MARTKKVASTSEEIAKKYKRQTAQSSKHKKLRNHFVLERKS